MKIDIAEGIRSILIVEDEGLVALMMEELVKDMGVRHAHVVADLSAALRLAETADLDCAVLDLSVRGGETIPVADMLDARGIPFVFSSGSNREALPDRHRHRGLLVKPFSDEDFRLVVLDAWQCRHGATRARMPRVASAEASE